ncbi:unnamed protein product [Protopolystoma xenopodis]|uniref:Uncharacterized protein n=1 Tax=Protopolystoma xenopodis TaxID=117903 RepID=A0A3S5FCL2_9PLAT|nr:unnamed protein product [Protopolystoma xenopodis]
MVSMDFSGISWLFVLAVSTGKAIVFLATFLLGLLLLSSGHHRNGRLGLAAICALFVSQQNDVALAYPICKSRLPASLFRRVFMNIHVSMPVFCCVFGGLYHPRLPSEDVGGKNFILFVDS